MQAMTGWDISNSHFFAVRGSKQNRTKQLRLGGERKRKKRTEVQSKVQRDEMIGFGFLSSDLQILQLKWERDEIDLLIDPFPPLLSRSRSPFPRPSLSFSLLSKGGNWNCGVFKYLEDGILGQEEKIFSGFPFFFLYTGGELELTHFLTEPRLSYSN